MIFVKHVFSKTVTQKEDSKYRMAAHVLNNKLHFRSYTQFMTQLLMTPVLLAPIMI